MQITALASLNTGFMGCDSALPVAFKDNYRHVNYQSKCGENHFVYPLHLPRITLLSIFSTQKTNDLWVPNQI